MQAAEYNPSPLAPPAPSPMQHGPSSHSLLALTPERPAIKVAGPKVREQHRVRAASSASSSPGTEAGLSSASPMCAPPKPLPHALSHPVINSTRHLDQQLRDMGKENAMGRGERGAVRLPEEALNKVRYGCGCTSCSMLCKAGTPTCTRVAKGWMGHTHHALVH